MMENLKSLAEIPDLRKRILFTLLMLAVYRLGSFVPTPGINPDVLAQALSSLGNTLFGLLSMFSGGSLGRLTVFALGIMPYITASIILQLLGVVSPTLEKLQKEGELGRRSEERRVGKECRSRWWPDHYKKKGRAISEYV